MNGGLAIGNIESPRNAKGFVKRSASRARLDSGQCIRCDPVVSKDVLESYIALTDPNRQERHEDAKAQHGELAARY